MKFESVILRFEIRTSLRDPNDIESRNGFRRDLKMELDLKSRT
jgi:hypothetical protein